MSTGSPATAETIEPPRPPRWIPLSLRMFLALVAILSAVTAWEGLRTYQQQVAIREIERLGGKIGSEPNCPKWMQPWLSAEQMKLFDRVVEVALNDTKASDETMACLVWLTSLRRVDLDGTRITDAGLTRLRSASSLEDLILDRTNITDAGLDYLKDLHALKNLSLSDTLISDAGLDSLKSCRSLKLLHVVRTQITDAGIADLRHNMASVSVWKPAGRDRSLYRWPFRHVDPPISGLSAFADKNLQSLGQLDSRNFDDQVRALTGDPPRNRDWTSYRPWWVQRFQANGADWVQLEASPGDEIEPEFQRQTNQSLIGEQKSTLVFCYAPKELHWDNESIDFELAKYVAFQCNANKINVVDPDQVYAWLAKNKDWRKTSEIGAAFDADYVVHIDLKEFTLYEANSFKFRGRAECLINVVTMNEDKKDGQVIYTTTINSSCPHGDSLDPKTVPMSEYKKSYLSFLSNEIGQLFYVAETEKDSGKTPEKE